MLVAAPMWKLWLEKFPIMTGEARTQHSQVAKVACVRGRLSAWRKRDHPALLFNWQIGHQSMNGAKSVIPLCWYECNNLCEKDQSWKLLYEGASKKEPFESQWPCPKHPNADQAQNLRDWQLNSANLKRPKFAKVQAAQNIQWLKQDKSKSRKMVNEMSVVGRQSVAPCDCLMLGNTL